MGLNNRLKVFKVKYALFFITLFSFLFVKDISFKLNSISKVMNLESKPNFIDISLSTLYGLNSNIRITMIDRIRWSLLFLLLFYFIGIYLNEIFEKSKKFIWIIRIKSKKTWVFRNILNISYFVFLYILYFFINIIIFSYFESSKSLSISEIFENLNPYVSNKHIGVSCILVLFLLIFTSMLCLALIQFTICLSTNNSNKGTLFAFLIIIISSITADTDLFNPFMFSKFNIIDSRSNYNVYWVIVLNIFLIILISFIDIIFLKKIERNN
ncbi:hypothetical protein ACSXBA_04585 [Clostridium perfringens]|uniref:Uncharacterized protein n=1 Tax=Clostridium tertium TaxID=1559 RepID=A0A9X3XKD4_9CLOT|nr:MULTISPECIES: hypothetical protein [Clostridium]AQW24501.1 hypothetical protein BXT91_11355 [Clostridium perfringens]MDC4240828.1 hypothetical protein [Clostridium tertium]